MVYLIHFDRPLAHARHYLGFVDHALGHTVEARLAYHRRGRGSKLLRAVVAAGIDFQVARVWPEGDRTLERQLKKRKKAAQLCPLCKLEDARTGRVRATRPTFKEN